MEFGGVSDSFICSWNIFPPTGVLSTSLILGLCLELLYLLMPFLVNIPGEDCSFLKENRKSIWGKVELGRKEKWRDRKLQSGCIEKKKN